MSSDARKRAEEALLYNRTHANSPRVRAALVEALEALLAAEPAPPAGAEVARLTALLRECNAVCLCGCPESEHESYGEDGESCADEGHECIRVAKAVLAYVERLRSAAPPPSDAVREAAEAIARRLFGSREHVALWDAINEFREAPNLIASEHAVVRVEDGLRAVILAALASPPAAPARDEVREAAEVRYATRPSRDDRRVPYCDEQCPQHDGKRCRLMGVQPSSICEPEVLNLIAAIAARSTTKGGQP